jgi:hypothetical protein
LADQVAVQLFPNPVENQLELSLHQPLNVSSILVRDALGRVVWRMAGQDNFSGTSIAVRNFNPGMYVVELQTANGNQSIQFVKK